MPLRGPWTFDGKVDTDEVPVGQVTIACAGGLQLAGTVDAARSGVVIDSTHLWIVGGAGGLTTPVSGAYQFAQLSDPLGAILNAAGEALSSTVDQALLSTQLPRWNISKATASSALTALCGFASSAMGQTVNWRTLNDGTIWVGVETYPAASLDPLDSIAMVYPAQNKTAVSVQVPTIGPGLNVDGIGQVSSVEHWIDETGVDTWLFTDTTDTGSAASLFRRNARAAVGLDPDPESTPRLDHLAFYPARVDAQASDGSTVDVTPINGAIPRQMSLPLRSPIPGAVVTMSPGAICRIGWDEGDPSKTFAEPIFDLGATMLTLVISAGTKITLTGGDIAITAGVLNTVKVNGGGVKVAAAGDTAGPYPIVIASPTTRRFETL